MESSANGCSRFRLRKEEKGYYWVGVKGDRVADGDETKGELTGSTLGECIVLYCVLYLRIAIDGKVVY